MVVVVMFLLIIIICLGINGKIIPLSNDYSQKHSLSDCLTTAINHFADYGEVLSVVISNLKPRHNSTIPFVNIFLEDISKEAHVSYISRQVKSFDDYEEYTKRIGIYLIHIRSVLELTTSMGVLTKDVSWNPHARFFIVSTYRFSNINGILSDMSEMLWEIGLLNYIVALPEENHREIFNIYTGYPYGECGVFIEVRTIDRCVGGKFKNNEWFPDKIPKKLNGCQVDVGTTIIEPFVMPFIGDYPERNGGYNFVDGFEIKLLNTIADYINMTLRYSVSNTLDPHANVFPNNSLTGPFLQLNRRELDIILGYVVSIPETQQIFDVITSYSQDSLVFCGAQAKRLHGLVYLSRNLDNSVLLILILLLIVVSTLVYLASHVLRGEIVDYKRYREVLTNTFLMMIGSNVRKLPIMMINRMVLIFWMISSYWFQMQYVTVVMNTLTKHHTGYQISVLEDIVENNMTVQYYSLCSDYLKMHRLDTLEKHVCTNFSDCLNKTVLDMKYVVCISKMNVQYLLHHFIDSDGYPTIYCFKDNIVTYPIQMLMWKGHPLKNRINDFVDRLSAGGFVLKWQKDVFYEASVKTKTFVPSSSIILKLSQLSIPFILLGVCYPVTLMVFVIELVTFRYKKE